jgi:hypothetical protein
MLHTDNNLELIWSDFDDISALDKIVVDTSAAVRVIANFAGHFHSWYNEYEQFAPNPTPLANPNDFNANCEYHTETLPFSVKTAGDIPVVTTEALMVGSNIPEGKAILRLVNVRSHEVDWNNFDAEVLARAVNPYLTVHPYVDTISDLAEFYDQIKMGRVPFTFTSYAFTKRVDGTHNIEYSLDFGDGTNPATISEDHWDRQWFVSHAYDGSPGRTYTARLTVTGYTPGGDQITEYITLTITPSEYLAYGLDCPFDMTVTDPQGNRVSKQSSEINGAIYIERDLNGDGLVEDLVIIPHRKIGDYLISVTPEPDALASDTYTFWLSGVGTCTIVAANVKAEDVPELPYTIRSTETQVIPVSNLLLIHIQPTSATINAGQALIFTSVVTGGYEPYSYQWYLNSAPVSGATSLTWTFAPSASGIYYVYLKVTDAANNTVQSDTARITAAAIPVGGYSIPIRPQTKAEPVMPYIALIAILTAIFTKLRPKTKRKR